MLEFLQAVLLFILFWLLLSVMGSSGSKRATGDRRYSASASANASSSAWGPQYYQQSPFRSTPQNPYSTPRSPYTPSRQTQTQSRTQSQSRKQFERKYSRIADNYRSLDEVTVALLQAGLESSNLIVGIDFTKSNEWTGARSFNRKSLHHIGSTPNPYEQAISIIGKTLSAFDEDNLIPCYGFGDATTHDQDVFSFYPEDKFCNGFEEVLVRYREIVPQLRLAGPTSFAPIIERAITIVEESGGQYHVLVIIADGQVTRSVDTANGRLSPQEQQTIDAIVRASGYPLSIVLVGVGDGPWDTMRQFDDNIPERSFDNFQFVNFTEIMSKGVDPTRKEAEFALSALMEIPSQYKATLELGLLGRRTGSYPNRIALLPPPISITPSLSNGSRNSRVSSFQNRTPHNAYGYDTGVATAPPSTSNNDTQVCPVCFGNQKNMAFNCGHQTCCECGEDLRTCPICRSSISIRIKLY
ncbi:PREDICTED: LOW QUALITY PROTEIN: E3 ubiquitin-protein ligase RGLG2 [Tarenaya hassleriana]|uniref:LOW QUALITY PROTEIN: E3 ubiquitin-protein ligase RGLG2 n=1 Tax=Tarenaya hassleriana TaxID=28532 RepID=UPI0008FCF65D|nr:PREDICTED: LOW QUALITY PROTEIN: E3 ubiquitin-protein ligase RGLG2 [Tarenaya hassleriana]